MSILDGLRGRNTRAEQAERVRRAAEAEQDGLACLRDGNLQRAVVEWRRCLEYRPDYPLALGYLGLALYRLGQLEEADEALRASVRIEPSDEVLRRTYGMVLEARGQLDAAAAQYQAAIDANPESARAHAALGTLALKQDALAPAEAHLQLALQLDPNDPQALSELAEVYQRQGRATEAVSLLERALVIRPQGGVYSYKLGLLFGQLHQSERACGALMAAHEALPSDPAVLRSLGRVLFEQQRGAEAHRLYDHAMREDPEQHLRYLTDLAALVSEHGMDLDTIPPPTTIKIGAEAAPGLSGEAQRRLDIASLEAAIEQQPGESRLRRDLSMAYLRAGRIEEAKQQAQLADQLRAQRRARPATA